VGQDMSKEIADTTTVIKKNQICGLQLLRKPHQLRLLQLTDNWQYNGIM
jgi:hypothetical protein